MRRCSSTRSRAIPGATACSRAAPAALHGCRRFFAFRFKRLTKAWWRRYIGTGCSVATRDLDSDWINVGTYRVQVIDRNHVALDMVPGKHGRIHYEKHKAAGKRFPVVIVCGADPLTYLISGIEIPFGMCEYDYMGAILGQPVSVVKGEVTGLPFPAASEIVLEGHVEPGGEGTQGPFGGLH